MNLDFLKSIDAEKIAKSVADSAKNIDYEKAAKVAGVASVATVATTAALEVGAKETQKEAEAIVVSAQDQFVEKQKYAERMAKIFNDLISSFRDRIEEFFELYKKFNTIFSETENIEALDLPYFSDQEIIKIINENKKYISTSRIIIISSVSILGSGLSIALGIKDYVASRKVLKNAKLYSQATELACKYLDEFSESVKSLYYNFNKLNEIFIADLKQLQKISEEIEEHELSEEDKLLYQKLLLIFTILYKCQKEYSRVDEFSSTTRKTLYSSKKAREKYAEYLKKLNEAKTSSNDSKIKKYTKKIQKMEQTDVYVINDLRSVNKEKINDSIVSMQKYTYVL